MQVNFDDLIKDAMGEVTKELNEIDEQLKYYDYDGSPDGHKSWGTWLKHGWICL